MDAREAAGLSDAEFLAAFEACRIPHETWDHRAHIRMAYLVVRRDGPVDAVAVVSAGIQKLNASQQTPEAIDRGYHETITQAWLRLVGAAIRHYGPGDGFESFAGQHPHLLCRTMLRTFYTRDRLMTWEAKRAFVEPDLAPLPSP